MEYGTAWIVIDAMLEELKAQQLTAVPVCDEAGCVHIHGTLDLAALACATESGLIEASGMKVKE